MNSKGISRDSLSRFLTDTMPEGITKQRGINKQERILKRYCDNLNEMAGTGKIDPVIGRENELIRITQILARRSKNNPILVGESGVGKTALIEGLAKNIIDKKVPEIKTTEAPKAPTEKLSGKDKEKNEKKEGNQYLV